MRKQYANRTTKLQNNTRTIKIHTEMPLAHICTRGIPIIYYQRKIYLLLIVYSSKFFTHTFSRPFIFCFRLPSPTASFPRKYYLACSRWGGRIQTVSRSLYQLYHLIIRKQHRACIFLYLESYGIATSLWSRQKQVNSDVSTI